jgi:hypothetical protein
MAVVETVYTPKQETAGGMVVSDSVTIASGQNLVEGAVVGAITASGKYVLSLSASTDGSEAPLGYVLEDVDATAGDVLNVPMRIASQVLESYLTIGTGHTVDTVKKALRPLGIYVKKGV